MRQTLIEIYDARVAGGSLRADPAQRAVLPVLEDLRAWLEAHATRKIGLFAGLFARPAPPPKGLYLWGGVGRGKSMVMDLFVEHLAIPAKRRVHFHAFMQEIHKGMHAARQKGVDDALKPVADAVARDVRLLAFDEIQITDITDAMVVGRLFQLLMDQGVVIVTTSNREPEDLYKNGLNRALFLPFIALIKERLEVIELVSGTDYRQGRLTGTARYFTPADAAARAAIDSLWHDLTHGGGHPLALRVKGRDVVIPAFHNGVARASFYDLCDQPLGPADYLTLAEAARVLILEDIPLLSADNFNQAKRFVTLVDALYEARTRLFCTAAARADRLYVEGEGSFEFERTASRLAEMQAADWGRTE